MDTRTHDKQKIRTKKLDDEDSSQPKVQTLSRFSLDPSLCRPYIEGMYELSPNAGIVRTTSV